MKLQNIDDLAVFCKLRTISLVVILRLYNPVLRYVQYPYTDYYIGRYTVLD